MPLEVNRHTPAASVASVQTWRHFRGNFERILSQVEIDSLEKRQWNVTIVSIFPWFLVGTILKIHSLRWFFLPKSRIGGIEDLSVTLIRGERRSEVHGGRVR